MANTYALNGVAGLNFPRSAGLFTVTVTVSDTYASSSGGITVDLTSVLALAPGGIAFANCGPYAMGMTTLGWSALATKTSTSGQYTVSLWNGTTQFSNGAITATLYLFIPLY